MERKQQSNEQVLAERTRDERAEEKKTRSLRLVVLEERVSPSAIWGD